MIQEVCGHKTIDVTGNGVVYVQPDSVIISIRIETQYKEYDKTMLLASNKLERLQQKFAEAGFDPDELKTTKFVINTIYENNLPLRSNSAPSTLKGYLCQHDLKIQFDFDKNILAKAIEIIASSEPNPKFSIGFTVKDTEKVKAEILKIAADDARYKAEVLCAASGVTLGELVHMNCSWHLEFLAPSLNISFENRDWEHVGGLEYSASLWSHTNPNEFRVAETVNFTWQII